jgi:hypothetical protein
VTYTTAEPHGYAIGDNVTVTGITGNTAYNITNLPIVGVTANTFWLTAAPGSATPSVGSALVIRPWVSGGTAELATRVTDMGWGESPASVFSDYLVVNSGYETASTSKTVQISGNRALEALAATADILMAGTTNKVIIENPNVGKPAVKINTMDVGIRYRHLKVTDVVKPAWWFQYGVNVKNFTIEDNLDKMATRAIVVNRNLDQSASSVFNRGVVDPTLYSEYGLIDAIEIINEERNDLEFSQQLQYNLNPDRLFSIKTDVIPNTISPFANYAVGDDITVYIVYNRADIRKDLTIVGQQWIGNANGAEYLMLSFAPRITRSFIIPENRRAKKPWSGRGRSGSWTDEGDNTETDSSDNLLGYDPNDPDLYGDGPETPPWMGGGHSNNPGDRPDPDDFR